MAPLNISEKPGSCKTRKSVTTKRVILFCIVFLALFAAGLFCTWAGFTGFGFTRAYNPHLTSPDHNLIAMITSSEDDVIHVELRCKLQNEFIAHCGIWKRQLSFCSTVQRHHIVEYSVNSTECVEEFRQLRRDRNLQRREEQKKNSREFREIWIIVWPIATGALLILFVIGAALALYYCGCFEKKKHMYCSIPDSDISTI